MPERRPFGRVSRRQFLIGAAAGAVGGMACGARAETPTAPDMASPVGPGLDAIARGKGLFFGSAVEGPRMAADPAYAAIVAHECGAMTPEGAMQWKAVQPEPDGYAFDRMDSALDYGLANDLRLRGHALLWYQGVPQWFPDAFRTAADWDRVVTPYIEAVAARYGRYLRHWDVVNEALRPEDGRSDGLRAWRLSELMGDDYVIRAFQQAHQGAPAVELYCNDYGIEYDDRESRERRLNLLRAFERWRKAGVPLNGLGMQSHLETRRGASDATSLRRFLADVAAMDLDIVVSELDVREDRFDESLARRDQIVADEAGRFLDVVLDQPRVRGVVAWGMSDRYSWLSWFHDKRNRGLMYDENLQPKPLRRAIATALRNAPARAV